jgi:Uma2 family endonuclease
MAEVGILGPNERTELIDGEIIDMPPPGSLHAGTVDLLLERFRTAVGNAAIVRVQNPIDLDTFSEPQPDIALLRPRADYYRSAHPSGRDVLLAVEVADSSLRYDRDTKVTLYARHGIPEVWLVDVHAKQLTRYRSPMEANYTRIDRPEVGVPVDIGMLPGVVVSLGGLFPGN